MRLLCITDLHGDSQSLNKILRAETSVDVILLGGDLTNFGTPNQAEQLVGQAQECCPRVWAVAGNCDSAAIDERLVEMGVSLCSHSAMHEDVGFFGVSAMPPWMGNMYEFTEDQIAAILRAGHEQVSQAQRIVVLSHAPPRNCRLDCTSRGQHVGSTAVRDFIDASRPALVVCGHIHEARGIDKLGDTTVVNCGTAYRGHYAIADLNQQANAELRSL